jgi:hypothetical protein
MRAYGQQVFAVAGDDQGGSGGHCGGDHMIVVGGSASRTRATGWHPQVSDCRVVRYERPSACARPRLPQRAETALRCECGKKKPACRIPPSSAQLMVMRLDDVSGRFLGSVRVSTPLS